MPWAVAPVSKAKALDAKRTVLKTDAKNISVGEAKVGGEKENNRDSKYARSTPQQNITRN